LIDPQRLSAKRLAGRMRPGALPRHALIAAGPRRDGAGKTDRHGVQPPAPASDRALRRIAAMGGQAPKDGRGVST